MTDRPASSQNVHFAGRVQGRSGHSGHCFFRLEPSSRGLVPGRLARTDQFLSPAWSQGFSQDGQAHASLSLRGSSRTTIPVAKACKATFPPCLLPWRLALLCTKAISPKNGCGYLAGRENAEATSGASRHHELPEPQATTPADSGCKGGSIGWLLTGRNAPSYYAWSLNITVQRETESSSPKGSREERFPMLAWPCAKVGTAPSIIFPGRHGCTVELGCLLYYLRLLGAIRRDHKRSAAERCPGKEPSGCACRLCDRAPASEGGTPRRQHSLPSPEVWCAEDARVSAARGGRVITLDHLDGARLSTLRPYISPTS